MTSAVAKVLVKTHVEPKLRQELEELARTQDRSVAGEMRVALREHVAKRGEPARA